MKRLVSIIIAFAVILSMTSAVFADSGFGLQVPDYEESVLQIAPGYDEFTPDAASNTVDISSADDLIDLSAACADETNNSGNNYYRLTQSIVLPDSFTPINWFYGTIDGGGFSITVSISKTGESENAAFIINGSGCTIKNISVQGSVSSQSGNAAAFVLNGTDITLENCINRCTVSGKNAAGFIASADTADITDCRNLGAVSGEKAGGIVTTAQNSSLSGCKNRGVITYTGSASSEDNDDYIAGIAGKITKTEEDNCEISESANYAVIKAGEYIIAGGIAGYCLGTDFKECANIGNINPLDGYGYTNQKALGGIAAYLAATDSDVYIEDCYNAAVCKGSTGKTGAIIGVYDATSETKTLNFTRCYGVFASPYGNVCYMFAGVVNGSSDNIVVTDCVRPDFYDDGFDDKCTKANYNELIGKTASTIYDNYDFDGDDSVWLWDTTGTYVYPILRSLGLVSNSISLWDGLTHADYTGLGTEENPYIISNGAELMQLSLDCRAMTGSLPAGYNTSKGTYYKLASDINLNNHLFTPVQYFFGNLNGNGKVISGLNIQTSGNAGLIIYAAGCSVSDLTLDGAVQGTLNTGAFAAYGVGISVSGSDDIYSTFTNCINCCTVTAPVTSMVCAGGILGRVQITQAVSCYNCGDITGYYSGGIIGWQDFNRADVSECINTGEITGRLSAGGIVGYAVYISIQKCENYASVSSTESYRYAGGIIGQLTSQVGACSIANCANKGRISAYYPGGISGSCSVNSGGSLSLSCCFTVGELKNLSGNTVSNRLIGEGSFSGAQSCYYLAAQEETGSCGTGKTADQMKTKECYEGFDFEQVWQYNDGSYPSIQGLSLKTNAALAGISVSRNYSQEMHSYSLLEADVTVTNGMDCSGIMLFVIAESEDGKLISVQTQNLIKTAEGRKTYKFDFLDYYNNIKTIKAFIADSFDMYKPMQNAISENVPVYEN